MQRFFPLFLGFYLAACAMPQDRASLEYSPVFYDTRINTDVINSRQRNVLLQQEEIRFKALFKPLEEKKTLLEAYRRVFYETVSPEFPLCEKEKHCLSTTPKTFTMPDDSVRMRQLLRKVDESLATKFRQPIGARVAILTAQREEASECFASGICEFQQIPGGLALAYTYRDLVREFACVDCQLAALAQKMAELQGDHDKKLRAIYNKYLAGLVMEIPNVYKSYQNFLVHSFEEFPTKRAIGERIFSFNGDTNPLYRSDYEFSFLGKPVDEAGLILTIDYTPFYTSSKGKVLGKRLLVSLLIHTHQVGTKRVTEDRYYRDPILYEKEFLRAWQNRLWSLGQVELRKKAFCSHFAMGAEPLRKRLNMGKITNCQNERAQYQIRRAEELMDRFPPEDWIIPLAVTEL